MDDIAVLREALAKEPTRGPWGRALYCTGTNVATVAIVADYVVGPVFSDSYQVSYDDHGDHMVDADYLAACDPDRITRILDRLERAEEALRELRKPIRVHRPCPAHEGRALTFTAQGVTAVQACFVCEQEETRAT